MIIEIPKQGRLVLNEQRAFSVAEQIIELYDNPDSFVNQFTPPQKKLPSFIERGSIHHADYLLALCACDSQNSSSYLYPAIREVIENRYQEDEDFLFNPETLIEIGEPERLREIFKYFGKDISPTRKYAHLIQNAHTTLESLEERSLLNLDKMSDYDIKEAYKKIQNMFMGIGEGTGALFLRYMVDENMLSFRNLDQLLLKVDIHKLRFPFALRFFDFDEIEPGSLWRLNDTEALAPRIQEMYHLIAREFSLENRVAETSTKLDEVIWRIGTELCSQRNIEKCRSCPFFDECQGLPFTINGQRAERKVYEKQRKALENGSEIETFGALGLQGPISYKGVEGRNALSFFDRNTKRWHYVQGWKVICPYSDCRKGSLEEQIELF